MLQWFLMHMLESFGVTFRERYHQLDKTEPVKKDKATSSQKGLNSQRTDTICCIFWTEALLRVGLRAIFQCGSEKNQKEKKKNIYLETP